ncbi:MAG: acetyl-CoA carboxylase biotin carboxylase subunit [Candidatus Wallbacteria bacterium]|nr:acetyl-CoA carboxylase biotin carboxylase subunit [Candidatus Wallbacteria bacterium]
MKKILIANRGEIALRIIRAVKELGYRAAVVYSESDRESLPVKFADEAFAIGKDELADSYLNIDKIVETARKSGCQAVHPGYGFLSENAEFAKAVIKAGMTFIGPTPEVLVGLGDKIEARKAAEKAGVPVILGYNGEISNGRTAKTVAAKIGYPLILKAAHGGGGRGMRIVTSQENLVTSVKMAIAESKTAFGSSLVFMERFISNSKHVEIQVLSDKYGNVIPLFERDCSVQRKHQKMIEEAPCCMMNQKLRNKLYEYAIRLVKATGYCGAGTVEFLFDGKNDFFFLEVNPRIQVEHPVTELISGIDIVKEQIRVCFGEELSVRQKDLMINGAALECRIQAEEYVPESGLFKPSFGRIVNYIAPSGFGVRVESSCFTGAEVTPKFDSMIAKIITHGRDRAEALKKMEIALSETRVEGISTNISFLKSVLRDTEFKSGCYFTNFLNEFLNKRDQSHRGEHMECAALVASLLRDREERKHKPVIQTIKKIINRWNLAARTENFRSRKGF